MQNLVSKKKWFGSTSAWVFSTMLVLVASTGCEQDDESAEVKDSTGLNWMTDFAKAQAQASKENKMILMDFTGSDWCGWCIKLKKEVFVTKEFADYAKEKLVLVEVDFPRSKPQTEELKQANNALKERFKPEGYPTIVVVDGSGKELWKQSGYMEGGPTAWIAKLEAARTKK